MRGNVGGLDRVARLFSGTGLLLGGYVVNSRFVMLCGMAVLTTGILGKCFIYDVVGVSTRENSTD